MATAVLNDSGYTTGAPEHVGDLPSLLKRTRDVMLESGTALLGFDFPIGIPLAYAERIGVSDFKSFVMELGAGEWSHFYSECSDGVEVTAKRPFYPHKPGGTSHTHLLEGLGLQSIDQLRRRCECAQDGRNAACPLFWTLGANQVGKGAIVGWRDVIAPALKADDRVKLWPFDGRLNDLLSPSTIVIAETYPAEYYRGVLGTNVKGKGKLEVRKRLGPRLKRWAEIRDINLQDSLVSDIDAGFPAGDDAFDSVVGLFAMLDVVLGERGTGEPEDPAMAVEGGILGQAQ